MGWVAALVMVSTGHAQDASDLIRNGDFAQWSGDRPAGWVVRKNKQQLSQATETGHEAAPTALQVELVRDGGSGYGEILQKLKLEPYTRYRLSGDIRSSQNGLGIYQVKTIRSGKEVERLNSDRSSASWKNVAIEFDTAGADEVQVLCRYRQKADNIGQRIWWTNVKLEKLGEGAPPPDPDHLETADPGADQFITPQGAGNRDGSSWDHARSAADGLQAALDAVGPGDTLHIGSGTYRDVSLVLAGGGSGEDGRLTIKGADTGGGLPRFVSDFDKDHPSRSVRVLLKVQPHAGFVTVEGLRLEDYGVAVVLNGPNRGVRITDVAITRSREGVIVNGGAIPHRPESGTRDLVIRDCSFGPYTKRGIRIRGGAHDVLIINCHADAGGREWATERFAMGFTVEGSKMDGVKDHDITYERCTSRNHWDPNGDKYWNADGFVAERRASNITYRDCGAFDNTDGGWDIKAENPKLINCVALRNKRNFRFWSSPESPAVMVNCVGAYAVKSGGTGSASSLWVNSTGAVRAERCTFVGDPTAVDVHWQEGRGSGRATLERCILAATASGRLIAAHDDQAVTLIDCIEYITGSAGRDPRLQNPQAGWEGGDEAFNSTAFPEHGARFPLSP